MAPKNIVIIGGGPAGLSCAVQLQKKLTAEQVSITLIEKNTFQFHATGVLRALVKPSFIDKLFIPIQNALPNHGTILQATATSINESTVTYQKTGAESDAPEETLPFDYLILATGSSYPSPIKPSNDQVYTQENMKKIIQTTAKAIEDANRIVIIGGGAVGCEMAGEIACAYPTKKLTLLDGHDELMGRQKLTAKFKAKLLEKVKALPVEVILSDRLETRMSSHGYETKTLTLKSGREIESDLQFVCAGMKPNVSLMEKWDQSFLADGKSIRVQANLSIKEHPNVFVLGDASNHETPKMAYWASEQGKTLGLNLATLIKKDTPVPNYPIPATELIVVPLGPNGGMSQFPIMGGITAGNFLTKMIKSKDLFVNQVWKAANATLE